MKTKCGMLFMVIIMLIVFPVQGMQSTKRLTKDVIKKIKHSRFEAPALPQEEYNLLENKNPFKRRYIQSRISSVKSLRAKKNPHFHLGRSTIVSSSETLNKPTSSFARHCR